MFSESQSALQLLKNILLNICYSASSATGALFFWGQSKPTGEATMYPKLVQDLSGWKIRSVGCWYVVRLEMSSCVVMENVDCIQ